MFLFISTYQHQNRSYFPLYNCLKYQHFRSLCKMTNPADLPVGPREGPIDPQVTTHRYQPRVCRYPRVPHMSLGVPPAGLWVPAGMGTTHGSVGTRGYHPRVCGCHSWVCGLFSTHGSHPRACRQIRGFEPFDQVTFQRKFYFLV